MAVYPSPAINGEEFWGLLQGYYASLPPARRRQLHIGDGATRAMGGDILVTFALDSTQPAPLFWLLERAQAAAKQAATEEWRLMVGGRG
jgi:hypothetical protein